MLASTPETEAETRKTHDMNAGTTSIETHDEPGHARIIRQLLERLRPAVARRDVDGALAAASALAGIARDKANGPIMIPHGGCGALAHWFEGTIAAWPRREQKAYARRIAKELGRLETAARPIYAHGAPIAWLELMLWDAPDGLHRFVALDPRLVRCWSACPVASWQVHLARAVGLSPREALEGLRAALVYHQEDWVGGAVPLASDACDAIACAVAPERAVDGRSAPDEPTRERERSEVSARLVFEALGRLSFGEEDRAWDTIARAVGVLAAETAPARITDRSRTFAAAFRQGVPESVVEAAFARACGFDGVPRALHPVFGEVFVAGAGVPAAGAETAVIALAGGERRTVARATLHDPAPDGRTLPFLLRSLALELLVSHRLSAVRYGALSSAARNVVCAQDIVREHANGGLEQYFFNGSGSRAHDAPGALAALGAAPHAAIMERAIAAFGGHVPVETEERRQISDTLSGESMAALSALDEELAKETYLGELIVRYVRAERETFEPILTLSTDLHDALES